MLSTVLIVVLLVILLGGLVPWDRGGSPPPVAGAPTPMSPFYSGYGYGWGLGGPLGILLLVLLVLALMGAL